MLNTCEGLARLLPIGSYVNFGYFLGVTYIFILYAPVLEHRWSQTACRNLAEISTQNTKAQFPGSNATPRTDSS